MRRVLYLAILGLGLQMELGAAPHNADPFELIQPDKSLVKVLVWGDEFHQHVESPDGYTLIRDPQTNWICYAKLSQDGKELLSTGIPYKGSTQNPSLLKLNPRLKNIRKHLRISTEAVLNKVHEKRQELGLPSRVEMWKKLTEKSALSKGSMAASAAEPDTVYGLTLLINFKDESSEFSKSEIEDAFNTKGYGQYGSIADYFWDVSNEKFAYICLVTQFVTVDREKSYYDTPNGYGPISELLTDALQKANDAGFDFSKLTTSNGRAIAFNALYAGTSNTGWANGIWPHSGSYRGNFSADGVSFSRYQLTGIGNTGVNISTIIHENGHMLFGWPDLYSYEDHTNGVGRFCIMNANATNPQPPNPYYRSLEGWVDLIDISSAPLGSIFSHEANSHSAYVYKGAGNGSNQEMYFIEARLKEGRSTSIPDEGLAIWHIDENGDNTTAGNQLLVGIEQADGLFQLENRQNSGGSGDLFHAGDNDRFNDGTTPSAKWHNGSNSGLDIANISEVGQVMTFSLGPDLSPFVRLSSILAGESYEQNQILSLEWFDNLEEGIKIELLNGTTTALVIEESYTGSTPYDWLIPQDLAVGENYFIRLTSSTNSGITSTHDIPFNVIPEFVISQFPYLESFEEFPNGESEFNNWIQASGDDLDWTIISGATPSKTHPQGGGTGPDADHTTGNSEEGKYIYTEASGENFPNKTMDFISPKFDLTSMETPLLSFWVHMFSADGNMGNLSVDVNSNGTWTEGVLALNGDHGDEWFQEVVDLTPYKSQRVQIRFRGITGTDYDSDIALDDILIGTSATIAYPGVIKEKAFAFQRGNYLWFSQHPGQISIYSIKGKLVYEGTPKERKLFVGNLPSGVYQLNSKTSNFKFVN